ncbi:MAG: hypothetical protein ACOCQG_05125 [Candidatus Nanoarchaeia archaeon]
MDVVKCNVCGGMFKESSDAIVLCNHMQSPVHMGCCSNLCSMHGGPCEHSQGMYEKMSMGMDSEMGNMGQEMDMGENMQMGQEMKQGQGMEMEENMDMRQNMDENMDMNKDMN